MIHNRTQYRT